jgi:polyvinyl alcohol dehydrogenase (cytochrome)
MQSRFLPALAALIAAASWSMSHAAAQATTDPAEGEAVFRRVCAVCHLGLVQMGPMAGINPLAGAGPTHAPPREFLHNMPPEAILNALTTGKMQAQGAALTPEERRAVAEYASGRRLGAKPLDPALEAGKPCATRPPMSDPARGPGWNGWGNGITNTRFQSRERGGLTAADLPRLELRWAFGFANVVTVRTQPAMAGGRLFVASENGQVHALDAGTGCTYWTYKARAGIATALSVSRYRAAESARYAVYFADRKANAYAVDAESGHEIWVQNVEHHPSASITGAPTVYAGRVFVPVQGLNEEGRGALGDYACCTFRGSVSALDATTGRLLWKTYTVEESRPRGKDKDGVELYGPAGGGIWSAPTVDARRRLVYVATGNGYAGPPQRTTNAIMALDMGTGAVRWVRQVLAADIWIMGCNAHNGPDKAACPPTLGPDFDFSAPPALARIGARELLVLPQKSGMAFALDPARDGRIVWRYRFGKGSGFGGQWGTAIEGGTAYFGAADLLTPTPGGVHAVRLSDGASVWRMPPPKALCAGRLGCAPGQGAALTAIPGAVLSGAMDGGLRAYSATDGSILWTYDCNRTFETVNGVPAHGGGIDGPGPIVAGGMLYVTSGSGGLMGGPGNVLLAFGIRGKDTRN